MKKQLIKFSTMLILASLAGMSEAATYTANFSNNSLSHNVIIMNIKINDPQTTTVQCSSKDLPINGNLTCTIKSSDNFSIYGAFLIDFEYTQIDLTCKYDIVHSHLVYDFNDPHPDPSGAINLNIGDIPPYQTGVLFDYYSRCEINPS